MEEQLHQREDDLHAKLKKLDGDDQQLREERHRHEEQIRRLRARIKEQGMEDDLKNNYLYWMMFYKWKKQKEDLGEPMKAVWGNPNFNNAPPNHRKLENEWTDETEELNLIFPDEAEIDNMDIHLDMFDVERFNSINDERKKNITELE